MWADPQRPAGAARAAGAGPAHGCWRGLQLHTCTPARTRARRTCTHVSVSAPMHSADAVWAVAAPEQRRPQLHCFAVPSSSPAAATVAVAAANARPSSVRRSPLPPPPRPHAAAPRGQILEYGGEDDYLEEDEEVRYKAVQGRVKPQPHTGIEVGCWFMCAWPMTTEGGGRCLAWRRGCGPAFKTRCRATPAGRGRHLRRCGTGRGGSRRRGEARAGGL